MVPVGALLEWGRHSFLGAAAYEKEKTCVTFFPNHRGALAV